jgi:hypothetical protein
MAAYVASFKKQTWALLTILASGTITVQIDFVKNHIIPLLANHPHLSTVGGALLMALAIIHNPVGWKIISDVFMEDTKTNPDGSQQTNTVTSQTVSTVPDDASTQKLV